MPEALTDDQIRHVARLARLELDPRQLTKYRLQLQSILHYVDQIATVDLSHVDPTAQASPAHNVLRDDEILPPLSQNSVLGNAPQADPPFFQVPKVIGNDEDSAG